MIDRAWHMMAEGDDGPFIPSMACEAIIRHCLDGKPPTPGARPATGDLELEDYEKLFARRTIHTGAREATADDRRIAALSAPARRGLRFDARAVAGDARSEPTR